MNTTSTLNFHQVARIISGMLIIILAALIARSIVAVLYLEIFFLAFRPNFDLDNLLLLTLALGTVASTIGAGLLMVTKANSRSSIWQTSLAGINIASAIAVYLYFNYFALRFDESMLSVIFELIYTASATMLLMQLRKAERASNNKTALSIISALLATLAMVLFPPLIFVAPFITVGVLVSLLVIIIARRVRSTTSVNSSSNLIK